MVTAKVVEASSRSQRLRVMITVVTKRHLKKGHATNQYGA